MELSHFHFYTVLDEVHPPVGYVLRDVRMGIPLYTVELSMELFLCFPCIQRQLSVANSVGTTVLKTGLSENIGLLLNFVKDYSVSLLLDS